MFSLRNILPKSIFWRAFLIIILPIVIMQMVVAWFFFNAHWARVTSNLSDSVAADVAVATQLFREDPTDQTAKKLDALLRPDMELSVVLRPGDTLPTATRNSFFSNLDKTLRRSLTEAVDRPFWFCLLYTSDAADDLTRVDPACSLIILIFKHLLYSNVFHSRQILKSTSSPYYNRITYIYLYHF